MESTTWLQIGVLVVLGVGALVSLRVALLWHKQEWGGLWLNLGSELAGAAVTYFLFELVIKSMEKRKEKREDEMKEREAKKADLIAQMGSSVKDVAIAAAEELRREGWLYDGSLRGVDLSQANLGGANLFEADLRGANLGGANLREAILREAILSRASLLIADLSVAVLIDAVLIDANLSLADLRRSALRRADLRGADLHEANLERANLSEANLEGAKLPDGTKWTPATDMARFTDPEHPDFWRPDALADQVQER